MTEESLKSEPEETQAPQEKDEAPAAEPPKPVESPKEEESTPAFEAPAPVEEKPKHSWFYRMLDPSTRFGRFMRSALRILAAIVGLFALGLLSGYLLLYRPLAMERDALQTELSTAKQSVSDTEAQLAAGQSDFTALQAELQQSQSDLENSQNTIHYLTVKTDLLRARVALKQQAGGPDAMIALQDAKKDLEILLPAVRQIDSNLANLLSSRLDVVMEELVRDPATAASELDELYTRLLELENLFIN